MSRGRFVVKPSLYCGLPRGATGLFLNSDSRSFRSSQPSRPLTPSQKVVHCAAASSASPAPRPSWPALIGAAGTAGQPGRRAPLRLREEACQAQGRRASETVLGRPALLNQTNAPLKSDMNFAAHVVMTGLSVCPVPYNMPTWQPLDESSI